MVCWVLLGLVFLLYTVVSLIQKVESSFNYVWQVERLRGLRPAFFQLPERYSDRAGSGVCCTWVDGDGHEQFTGTAIDGSRAAGLSDCCPCSKLVPYLLIIAAFYFLIYVYSQYAGANPVPALIGGVVAGVLWQSSGWAFAAFIASSSNYAAIYSGFAILILLLIWLYLNWLILLLGAQVAFYMQYPQYMTREPVQLSLSNRLRERLALQIMFMVADHHLHNRAPWTSDALVHHLGLPMQPIHHVLQLMVRSGFLAETSDEPPAYLPRRDVETISLSELYEVVRSAGENRFLSLKAFPHQQQVDRAMAALQSAVRSELGEQTLKDLVENDGIAKGWPGKPGRLAPILPSRNATAYPAGRIVTHAGR